MSFSIASGSRPSSTMSEITSRPPGFSTRAISANTRPLSGTRLITQLLVTASTLASSTGSDSSRPSRNSTCVAAMGADLARREEGVDAAARAEVEHGLTLAQEQMSDRCAAAQAEVGALGQD